MTFFNLAHCEMAQSFQFWLCTFYIFSNSICCIDKYMYNLEDELFFDYVLVLVKGSFDDQVYTVRYSITCTLEVNFEALTCTGKYLVIFSIFISIGLFTVALEEYVKCF